MKLSELLSSFSKPKYEAFKEIPVFNRYWDSVDDKAVLLIELLEHSPKCEVLLELFDREGIRVKDLQNVFTALGNILLTLASEIGKPEGSTVGDRAKLTSCAQETMQILLQKHGAAFTKTLNSRNTGNSIVPTLRCLTAGVLACEASAAEVVSSLDWTLIGQVINRRDSNPLINPRTWCCYLYTAIFEMHDNEAIFDQFLRSGALTLLYEGLQDDSPELIVDILTKLREKVLFNKFVDKRTKVQLFNGTTMEPIVALHQWPQKFNKSDKQKIVKEAPEDLEELEQAKQNITEALAKFLRPLCSSYKFGIAFAGTNDHLPNNGHALKIISSLTVFAFLNPAYRDIVSSTLVACPDILPPYALSIKSSFDIATNKYFKALMQVYIGILSKVDVSYVIERDHEFILKLLLPVPLSGNYIHSIICHHCNDFSLKVCGLELLEKILVTAEKVIKGLLESSYLTKANIVEKTVQNFLQKAVTNIDEIMSIWSSVNQTTDATESDTENLLLVVKVLSLYGRFLPSPDLNSIIKPEQLLAATIQMTHLRDDDKLQLLIACLHLINTLQSKFDVLSQARDEVMQQDLLDTFKLLLSLYLEGMNADDEETSSKQKNILEPLVEHIEKTLVNYGFSAHSEANIRFWLESLVGRDEACVDFLCQSIVTTIASLEQYSDQVVVITRNTAVEQAFKPSLLSTTMVSVDLTAEDSTDIVSANIPLSFSRLILGNLELLAKKKSAPVMDYFYHVIEQYIRQLPDPQVLAQYLLTDTNLKIPKSLARCCRCWLGQRPDNDQVQSKGETLADKMDSVFMTKDYHSVTAILKETSSLPTSFEEKQRIIKSTLLFLQVDISDTANVDTEAAIGAYIKILKHLTLGECIASEEGSSIDLCTLALNHPTLIKCNPFQTGKLSAFVVALLRRVSDDSESNKAVLIKYFKRYCQRLDMMLTNGHVDVSFDYWTPFDPLLSSVSYSIESLHSLLEILFTFSELFTQSASILNLALQSLQTLKSLPSENATQDSKLHPLLHSTLDKYASVITGKEEPSEDLLTVLKCVWDLLALALQLSDAAVMDHSKLKSLLSLSQSLGGSLLLRALQLHPPHAAYIMKRFTKSEPVLPGHGSVLLFLLELPDAAPEFVLQMLEATKPTIVAWLKEYDAVEEPGYYGLTALMVTKNLIGGGEAGSVVKATYGRLVEEGDAPPEHLTTLCLVCESLKGHKKESRLPCPDALVSSLHLLLCYVERKFSRHVTAQQTDQVTVAMQRLHDLLPKLHRRTRPDRARSDLWLKFAKKVIKTSLRECSELGAQMLSCLGVLCEWQYSIPEGDAAPFSSEQSEVKPLSVKDLHLLLVTHARYDNLMMKATTDVQLKVKEVVLELQSTLLRLNPAAARDLHASKILASYNATTQPHDQAALQLLKQYEDVGGLEQLLPVMWGDAAVPYYGVGSVMPVFREPRPEQVLALYDAKTIMNTCINYDRSMSSKASVRCTVPSSSVGPVYDLRHLLPSLVFVARKYHAFKTVPREMVLPQMVAVALASLAAEDLAIRSQAVKLIRILRLVLERIESDRLRLFWVWLLDIVCYTLAHTASTARWAMEKIKKSKKQSTDSADATETANATGDDSLYPLASVAPLSGPIARFLVETVMTAEHPEHPLYFTLMNYMFLFPYMKTNKIPELQRLYHNCSPHHSIQAQLLLLRMLSQGIRTTNDFNLAQRVHVVPLIISLLHSPTATHQIQLEAVAALTAMVATSTGCNRLLRHHELLQLLPSFVQRSSAHEKSSNHSKRDLIGAVMELLCVAWRRLEQDYGDDRDGSSTEPTEVEGEGGVEPMDAEEHVDENGAGYNGYDEDYYDEGYDEYDEDYFSDEEKSKVRKKRKLEAKNKKAAKKAKLEETVQQNKKSNKNVVAKMDTLMICDYIQCLLSIASRVFQTKDVQTVEKLKTLTNSIDSYIKTKVNAKKLTALLTSSIETLVRHVAPFKDATQLVTPAN